ncbi:ATP-binding protein [Nonomuraea sp. SYSU D8015]|uniref:ATP-binding protein n=1 Tax=Nonomuraea sp. SYSU D8015 TaxID=2593644 RepID=UPI00166168E1|nr:ATP-binding protein [Nonomuraea sp. SYSU D8015]
MSVAYELHCPIRANLDFIRDLIRVCGRYGGLTGQRLEDLVLAVNEAVANVLVHGGKAGLVTARSTPDELAVEVLDSGGRLRHHHLAAAELDPERPHGFGLWLIQHLCDHVALQQTGLGSLLSLHMRLHPADAANAVRAHDHTAVIPRPRHGGQLRNRQLPAK